MTSWSYVSRNWSLTQNLASTANDVTLGFVFNPAGQAIERTTTNTVYDFTPAASLSQAYTRNGLNQYTAVSGTSQTFDARGNLTGDGSRTYGYDLENRLTSISGAQSLAAAYDPLGRLRTVTTGGATTTWLWDGDRLVAEYDNAGVLSARYAHGPGPDEPLASWLGTTSSTRLWFHQDHQNSTIAMTDGTGSISGTAFTYSPYGEADSAHGYGGPRFRFTGQTSLPGAPPLWHYKARAYAPGIGRFLQTDPTGYEDSLNLYAYVGNDPFNATDPTGMAMMQDRPADVIADSRIRTQYGDDGNVMRRAGQWVGEHPTESADGAGRLLSLIPTPYTRLAGSVLMLGARSGAPPSGPTGTAVPVTPRSSVREGIYEFPDQQNGGLPYVGQSGNIPSRLRVHERGERLQSGTESSTPVPGGRLARERAEYERIQEITEGVPARQSGAVSNQRDPLGPRRRQ